MKEKAKSFPGKQMSDLMLVKKKDGGKNWESHFFFFKSSVVLDSFFLGLGRTLAFSLDLLKLVG
jgi:hypothetical protein